MSFDSHTETATEQAAVKLLNHTLVQVALLTGDSSIIQSVSSTVGCATTVRETAEMDGDGGENFDGWLPLRLAGATKYYDYTLQELNTIRNAARSAIDVNEVAKNIILHRRNFIVGRGITIDIYPEDLGDDPVKLAKQKVDGKIKKMKSNWKLFCTHNKFITKLWDWQRRVDSDGEAFIRLFKGPIPSMRFMEPEYVVSNDSDIPYGIQYNPDDAETPISFKYKLPDNDTEATVAAAEVIHDKRNVVGTAPRGIPYLWPVMANLRRLEKILVNSTILATVQAAITMVRKHQRASGPKVSNFVRNLSDGVQRTDPVSNKPIMARKVRSGTVLDAPNGVDYEFPSHKIDAKSFISIAEHELIHIAQAFVLPVEWLLTTEPKDPLTPGSPVIANFETEQEVLFTNVEELFWRVQRMFGMDADMLRLKYCLYFNGKRLAVGKALDEARVDEIMLRAGGTSPQEITAKYGGVWAITRANMIKYRATKQPGEAMPGDAGNTNPSSALDNGGDGVTKKTDAGTTARSADGDGGAA